MSRTLFDECRDGNVNAIKDKIPKITDINMIDDDNDEKSPLYIASEIGYLDIVKLLIASGGDVNQANKYGETPLHAASYRGHLDIVKVLIAAGGDVNKACNDGWTPLHVASYHDHLEIVKVLIAAGGDVNKANNEGKIPLFNASKYGHLAIVKVLIANKANFLYKNKNGKTPLDIAKTDEIKQYIMNHPWYRRRPFLVARPHDDHETNEEHQPTPLGEIITATKCMNSNSEDSILFQLKIKIASYL